MRKWYLFRCQSLTRKLIGDTGLKNSLCFYHTRLWLISLMKQAWNYAVMKFESFGSMPITVGKSMPKT